MTPQYVDIAIIGGGLAGNLLARQLRQTVPHLNVAMFEKARDTSFKVGEATVEITGNYLIRRLGLSRYLYEHHLPKNGLRFFFDTPGKNSSFPEMSEIGGTGFPFHPSFQLDRSRLEADLYKMNRADGVQVFLNTKVQELSLGPLDSTKSLHRFIAVKGSTSQEYECRWLVDASGRSSVLARHLGLRVDEPNHALGAAWGRFREVADLDTFGPDEFRRRIRFTSRMLSTNHFCYPGYWIWFIPLGNGITSVGVVMDHATPWDQGLRKKEEFLSFLAEHKAVWSLLAKAELIDMGSYGHLTYNTKQFFSENRWGLTGEAAVFTDPFYSPGSDFIALENDFLSDLILRDDQGENPKNLNDRLNLYNQYMKFRYDASMLLYRDLYSLFGSFDLLKMKWQFDFALYYHVWLSQYMQDLHLQEAFLKQELENKTLILNALSNFSDLFRNVEHHMRTQGVYYQSSSGCFSHALQGVNWVEEVGLPREIRHQFTRLSEIFNKTRHQALDLLEGSVPNGTRAPLPLSQFLARGTLA